MTALSLATALDEAFPRVLADVEAATPAHESDFGERSSPSRLPGLLSSLIAHLRAVEADETREPIEPPHHSDIDSFVRAIRLLKRSIDVLIDARQLPVTIGEMRVLGDWFFCAAQSALAVEQHHVHERKDAVARLQLLSKLGALAETMDHESIIDAVARLSIPELSDWCIVDIVEHGEVRRGTIAHSDPSKATLAEELSRFPPQLQTLPVGKDALAGISSLVTNIEHAIESANPAFIEMIRRLDMHSAMVIPFVVLGEPVALAVFATTSDSGRTYTVDDLRLAEEMARRAAQIIENARLHQELRRSEARFRLALQHANISVFETDSALRFTWGYNSMLGVSDALATGKTLSEVVGPEVGEAMDELKRCVIATGEGVRRAFSPTIDGKRRHLMVRYEPLRDDCEVIGITGATIDVTDVKEAEELLARELAFRERMMGILGHDLRNPVSAVLALAGLMGFHEDLGDKAREQLAMIQQAARRMNEMIGTLLDFTRLRFRGSLPVAFEEIELDDLARGVVAELQAADRRRAIELFVRGDLKGCWDPGRIAQMLSNLATNALAHGARETPISLTLNGNGDFVSVEVSNRGPTIPSLLIEQLFEPFQQGAESAGTMRRGLGLGLFIVREIVRAHGGSINVRSQDDFTDIRRRAAADSRLALTQRGVRRHMRQRWVLALLLGLLGIILYLDRVCIGIALPRIQRELHLLPEQLGWISLAFSVGYAILEIPGGRWGDRFGPRRVLTGIVIVWSLFTAVTGMVQGLWALLLVRFLFGAAEAGALPCAAVVISRWLPAQTRARAFGLFLAASQLGAALAPILVVPIQERHGWRVSFFVFGAIGVIWAIAWYAWFRDSPSERTHHDVELAAPKPRVALTAVRAFLREPTLWALSASFFCGIYAAFFAIFWAPTFLVRARGFSEAELRWSAVMWVTGLVCSYFGGAVSDAWVVRFGRARGRRAAGALGLVVVAFGYGLAAATHGKASTLAAITLASAGFSLAQATSFAVCVDVGREESGTAAGVMNTAGQLGGSLSAVVFGYLVKATGSYEIPLVVMSAVAAVGALCWAGVDASKPIGCASSDV